MAGSGFAAAGTRPYQPHRTQGNDTPDNDGASPAWHCEFLPEDRPEVRRVSLFENELRNFKLAEIQHPQLYHNYVLGQVCKDFIKICKPPFRSINIGYGCGQIRLFIKILLMLKAHTPIPAVQAISSKAAPRQPLKRFMFFQAVC